MDSDRGGHAVPAYPWRTIVALDVAAADFIHVDNIRIASLFNEARGHLHAALVNDAGKRGFSDQMIARIAIDFVAELLWQPDVEVRGGIGRVGTTSYAVEMVIAIGGRIMARCVTVNVWIENGRPAPISDEARAVLRSYGVSDPTPA